MIVRETLLPRTPFRWSTGCGSARGVDRRASTHEHPESATVSVGHDAPPARWDRGRNEDGGGAPVIGLERPMASGTPPPCGTQELSWQSVLGPAAPSVFEDPTEEAVLRVPGTPDSVTADTPVEAARPGQGPRSEPCHQPASTPFLLPGDFPCAAATPAHREAPLQMT